MLSAHRLPLTPGTAISLVALFFALGGSAFAVGERIQGTSVAQQRCTNGAVRGIATVVGDPSKGIANLPDRFTSANVLFTRKFNCTGKAVQVRRTNTGVFEVRFVGNDAPSAMADGFGPYAASADRVGPGTFKITIYGVGSAGVGDAAFMVVAV